MDIKFYTTHCPKCLVLEKKLKNSGLEYQIITDIEFMKATGKLTSPLLEVDGRIMEFSEAVSFLNSINK